MMQTTKNSISISNTSPGAKGKVFGGSSKYLDDNKYYEDDDDDDDDDDEDSEDYYQYKNVRENDENWWDVDEVSEEDDDEVDDETVDTEDSGLIVQGSKMRIHRAPPTVNDPNSNPFKYEDLHETILQK